MTSEVVRAGAAAGERATVNFVETGSAIGRLRWSQLYSPLGLAKASNATGGGGGDIDPAYADVSGELVDNLYAQLDFGCLTFAYRRVVPNATGESIIRHVFPVTPQRLGAGFIVGRERAVTKVSGSFAPDGNTGPLCVRSFDRDGWQLHVQRDAPAPVNVTLPFDGAAFAVVVPDADCEGSRARDIL